MGTNRLRHLSTVVLLTACAIPLATHASVTFNINYAEYLKDAGGTPIPENTGLILLVAGTDGDIDMPTPSSFFPGGNLELGRWDITDAGPSEDFPGFVSEVTQQIDLTGGLDPGDPVGLFWFPTLSLTATEPGNNTPYGFYTDPDGGLDGSGPWTVPLDGAQRTLAFRTSDSPFGGSSLPSEGIASNLTAVPEPQTYAMMAAASLAGFAAVRRYRKSAAH